MQQEAELQKLHLDPQFSNDIKQPSKTRKESIKEEKTKVDKFTSAIIHEYQSTSRSLVRINSKIIFLIDYLISPCLDQYNTYYSQSIPDKVNQSRKKSIILVI